jgi:hypothetical protein
MYNVYTSSTAAGRAAAIAGLRRASTSGATTQAKQLQAKLGLCGLLVLTV